MTDTPRLPDPAVAQERAPRPRNSAFRFIVAVIRPVLNLITRRDWRGAENLPLDRGFIAAGNHVSHVDPLVIGQFLVDNDCPPRFLGKDSLFKAPVIGKLITAAGQIPVHRQSADASKAFRSAIEAVEQGECVTIYPEGTLTRDPNLWPMIGKTGVARIALSTGCPVIPIAQWGPQELLEPYAKWPHLGKRHTMHVWAGPAVDLSAFKDRPMDAQALNEATELIMAAITDLLEQIRGEQAPSQRWDPRAHGQALTGDPNRARKSS